MHLADTPPLDGLQAPQSAPESEKKTTEKAGVLKCLSGRIKMTFCISGPLRIASLRTVVQRDWILKLIFRLKE